eukprot:scaffold386_cov174-Ochromonas_danica.AAC.8
MDINRLWQSVTEHTSNNNNHHDDNGVYFYGTPGTTFIVEEKDPPLPTNKQTSSLTPSSSSSSSKGNNKLSFKDIIGQDETITTTTADRTIPAMYLDAPDHRPRCRFFQAGNCKFGSRCRFSHYIPVESLSTDNSHIVMENVNKLSMMEEKECGICIEPPRTAMYGLLSHCDCKFCLDCIRGWRKEGVVVAKENERVRLCPLCRKESYFIIPSVRFVPTGPEKEVLIETYRGSLQQIPCKVSVL